MSADTETVAFALRVRAGREAEYARRHRAVWPEMRRALLDGGILDYEIYLHAPTRVLFARQVRRAGVAPTPEGEAVMRRWRAYMADVLEMDGDRPAREDLTLQYRLTGPDRA